MKNPSSPEIFDDTKKAFLHLTDSDIIRAHFVFSVVNHPWVSAIATGLLKAAFVLRLPIGWIVKPTIFSQFCGGETIQESERTIDKIGRFGVKTILDYSVEGEQTEDGFDLTCREVLRTFEVAANNPLVPFCVFKVTGLADAELLERVSSKVNLTADESAAFKKVKERVEKICRKAFETNVPVLIDAEETWIQDAIDALALEMMKKYNGQQAIVFNTFQMYRLAGLDRLKLFYQESESGQFYLGVKLVRGAYMEKERKRALELGYESPIHPDKQSTDYCFDQGISLCLSNIQRTAVVCGSHNEESTQLLIRLMADEGLSNSDSRIWFSQLLGMSDNISFNLADLGYNVVKYVPFGPVRSVIPYLIRRAEENTSVAGQSSRELLLIRQERARRKTI